MTITEQKTLEAPSAAALDAKVTASIADGFQPAGSTFNCGDWFYQTMTKGVPQFSTTFYGESSSAANTYAVTITGGEPLTGNIYAIKLDHAPTNDFTININSTGAVQVLLPNGNANNGAQGVDGQIFWMVYSGNKYILAVTPNNA